MANSIEKCATEFLEQYGFKHNGQPHEAVEEEEQDIELDKTFWEAPVIIEGDFSGSLATREVNPTEMIFMFDPHTRTNYENSAKYTMVLWQILHKTAQVCLLNGYGICRYDYKDKKGLYLILYKLNDNELDQYKENYLAVCESYGIDAASLRHTKRLYGLAEWKVDYSTRYVYVNPLKKTESSKKAAFKALLAYKEQIMEATV